MYKISVPLQTRLVAKEKEKYLQFLKRSDAERVFLIAEKSSEPLSDFELLRETRIFFEENGIEVAAWVGSTIGHGSSFPGLEGDASSKKTLFDLNGEPIHGTHCPFDEDFCKKTGKYIADLAKHSGIKLIFLDDDYRLSQHGTEFCCACEMHMQRISEILGENITREQLRELAFRNSANKYRQAWLTAQRESLEKLAHAIRNEVDKVDETVTVALCAAHSIWGVDGSSATDIAKILAGKNKAVVRLHPAPYWAALCSMPLPVVCEISRMFSHLAKDVEILAEGDSWPRPRYSTPASYVEIFDAAMRADGNYDGILKYSSDYVSHVDYETGYFEHHINNLPALKGISEIFKDKLPCGVYTPVDGKSFEKADFSFTDAYKNNYPFPFASRNLAMLSIPTTFENNGIATALFSQEALEYDAKESLLLDGASAYILFKKGIDVGIKSPLTFIEEDIPIIKSENDTHLICINRQNARFLKAELDKSASVSLKTADGTPLAYTYESPSGQKFAVTLFDTSYLSNDSAFFQGYFMQEFFMSSIEWLSNKKLPVKIKGCPDLYVIAKKSRDNKKMAVGLFNCHADSILKPFITLDKDYSEIKFINCSGTLKNDTVILDAPINAFSFAAFEVSE